MKQYLTTGLVLALSACTSLDAVRDISTRLSSASASWNEVGGEIFASCQREAGINPVLVDCNLEKQASDGLAGANAVLANYFKALMDAANESNFTIQPGLEQASASAAKIPGINADQVKAVSGLFGLLARIATDTLREATLRNLIEEGGPSAQTVVQGMDGLVVPRLTRELETERLQLTGQFSRLILASKDPVGSDPAALCQGSAASKFSGTGYLLSLEYCRRTALLMKRTKALGEYQASLVVANSALTELQSSKTKLKAKDLAQQLYGIGADLDEKVAAVRKAFG